MPATDLIRRFDYENVFMYIDPPYLLSTRTGKQYKHEMTDKDHMEFLDTLLNSKAKIMLSGYRHPLYDEKLKEWKRNYRNYLDELPYWKLCSKNAILAERKTL